MVWAIKVDDKYYSFKYKVFVNSKVHCEDKYENDHVWQNNKPIFRKHLKEGYATQLVLERINLNQPKTQTLK